MNIISVLNPRYANAAQTLVTADVDFEGVGVIPFTASPNDSEAHGRDVFAGLIAGTYGPIAAFIGPTVAQARTTKLAQLEQARDAAERADVTVGGKVYSGSEAFQAKVSRMVNQTARGKPVAGANDAWRTADAQPVVMTATLLGLIEDAINAQGAAAWARFWLRFDAVQAASTNAAVDVIVW